LALQPVDPRFTETLLSDAEAHATRARLESLSCGEHRQCKAEVLRSEVKESLRQEPANGLALVLGAVYADDPNRLALIREATHTAPDDWRTWLFLSHRLPDGPATREERSRVADQMRRLAPERAVILNHLAWEAAMNGRADEAYPLAERAVRRLPVAAYILDTYALAAVRMGRCAEGLAAAQAAADRAVNQKAERRFRETHARFSEECRKGQPDAAKSAMPP
jgi:tetratricopeptide (TPR) repeat protein